MSSSTTLPDDVLYVANVKGGDISVIDLGRAELIDSLVIGGELDDAKADPSGDVFFVSRKDHNDLLCASRVTGETRWTVPLGGKPHHITVSPDGRYVYVPIFDRSFLEVVDTVERRVVAQVPVGDGSHGTRLSKDGTTLYVGTCFSNTISIVDAATFEIEATIPFPAAVRPFDITADERRLYVQLSLLHGFVVVDLPRRAVIETVELPPLPAGTEPAIFDTVDHGLALTPDGSRVVCAATTGDYVTVHRTADHALEGQVQVASEPAWVMIDGDGTRAFVPCREADVVSIIDLRGSPHEAARVETGRSPGRMVHWRSRKDATR